VHLVLGRDPPLPFALHERRHLLVDRRGAKDDRPAGAVEDRPFGVALEAGRHLHRAERVERAAIGAGLRGLGRSEGHARHGTRTRKREIDAEDRSCPFRLCRRTTQCVVLSIADVVLSIADVVLSIADVVLSIADVEKSIADVVLSIADVVLSIADVEKSIADVVLSIADVVLSIADVVLSIADVEKSIADVEKPTPAYTCLPFPLDRPRRRDGEEDAEAGASSFVLA
jgi:hypothetical protein